MLDKTRFLDLWERACLTSVNGTACAVYEDLRRRYSEGGRRYHTPDHIEHCLRQFDLVRDEMDDADAVEMAIWFHDAIYEFGCCENELRSAELFATLVGGHVTDGFRERVHRLIMITTHRELPSSRDECFIVDIDLSSFGLPWEEFVRDSVAVRDEFDGITDKEFFSKQRMFLAGLLSRDRFCFTDFFRARHESLARENIGRHLHGLESRGLS